MWQCIKQYLFGILRALPIVASVAFSFVAIYMLTVIMVVASLFFHADSKNTNETYKTAIVANSTVISLAVVFLASVVFTVIGDYLVIIVRHLLLDMPIARIPCQICKGGGEATEDDDATSKLARDDAAKFQTTEKTYVMQSTPHHETGWRFG